MTAFLMARFDEDERSCADRGCECWGSHHSPDCPISLRADVDIKRQITAAVDGLSGQWYDEIEGRVLSLLALRYADHADYQQEWRP